VAPVILLDTHLLVWLYGGLLSHIPAAVQRRLNQEQLALSPFVRLELGYLYEVGRVRAPAEAVIDDLSARLELVLADVSSSAVCRAALALTWTRDPFDRLLAAHATVSSVPLITKDETIRRHLQLAWWAE
jgi:PIN domain nuclease of toxin-antitoxin system